MTKAEERFLYSMPCSDFEGKGVPAHGLLEASGHIVVGGGGVRADAHSSRPRVEFVVDSPLSQEEMVRLKGMGYPMIEGALHDL